MKRFVVGLTILMLLQTISYADIFEYCNRDEDVYKWELVSQESLHKGAELFEIKLTSQKWQDITWEHRLRVIKPEELTNPSLALLMITGSGGGKEEIMIGTEAATDIGALFVILHDVPNQPLFGSLREDGIISYTFVKYMETRDETWPLLFPMTKSAVKAMDAIQEFAGKELNIKVSGFLTTGASKRGWTTWFSAAVDERVKAIAPIVYDNLGLPGQMEHQLDAWGKYSEQISDYTEKNLPQVLSTEEGKKLSNLVDPYFYRDKIDEPKLIIIGTNDRYWPLDALDIYYDDLLGEKYIFYGPNSGHGMDGNIVKGINTISAFFLKTAGKIDFPDISWECEKDSESAKFSIFTDPKVKPKKIALWKAESPTRDFRDAKWQELNIESNPEPPQFKIKKPESGFVAFFGETLYDFGDKEYSLSTNVYILGE